MNEQPTDEGGCRDNRARSAKAYDDRAVLRVPLDKLLACHSRPRVIVIICCGIVIRTRKASTRYWPLDSRCILLRMRARWVIWVAGGLLVLAVILLLAQLKSSGVNVQVLGKTNGYRTLLITNGTQRLHYVAAWAEVQSDRTWQRDVWHRESIRNNAFLKLEPRQSIVIDVFITTNTRPRRIAFASMPTHNTGQVAQWIGWARGLLGIPRASMELMYIDDVP